MPERRDVRVGGGNSESSHGYVPKWISHRCEGHWYVNDKEVSQDEYRRLTGEKW